MARLEGKVEELSHCLPGDRLAVWYSDDDIYHERVLIWRVSDSSWFILTPDLDLYEEVFDDPASGPQHFKIKGVHYRYNSRLRGGIYRFALEPTEEDMKKHIFAALDEMGKPQLSPGDWLPANVKVEGRLVSTTKMLEVRAVPRRVTRGGGQVQMAGEDPLLAGLAPDLLNDVLPICGAPEGHVWLYLPRKHEDGRAREVPVVRGQGVMLGPRLGLAIIQGAYHPVELYRMEEVPTIMEKYQLHGDHAQLKKDLGVEDDVSKEKDEGQAVDSTGADGENPDARVLDVDYDAQGERYKEWRQVSIEAKEYVFSDWPLDGPLTTGHLIKHFAKFGGDPKRWLNDWMRSKQIQDNDRITFEMKVLIESIYLAGTYDQLNLSCLASVEVIARRIQAVVDAYSAGSIPDWGSAKVMTLYRSPEDAISPQLRTWAARKNKEEMELAQSRAKFRDSRKGLSSEEASASAVADGALPGAGKTKQPKGIQGGESRLFSRLS